MDDPKNLYREILPRIYEALELWANEGEEDLSLNNDSPVQTKSVRFTTYRGRQITFTLVREQGQEVEVQVDHALSINRQTRTVVKVRPPGDDQWVQIHEELGPSRPTTRLQVYCERLR